MLLKMVMVSEDIASGLFLGGIARLAAGTQQPVFLLYNFLPMGYVPIGVV
jgi:hypothetical protein